MRKSERKCNVRILIIEDNEEMVSLLKGFVEKEGFKADSVEKGTYAFKKLLTESFSLIVTDIQIPGFNGLDIIPGLKQLQPETPIIVITAFGNQEVQRRAYEMGATVCLEKPICFDKLRELINGIMSTKEKS